MGFQDTITNTYFQFAILSGRTSPRRRESKCTKNLLWYSQGIMLNVPERSTLTSELLLGLLRSYFLPGCQMTNRDDRKLRVSGVVYTCHLFQLCQRKKLFISAQDEVSSSNLFLAYHSYLSEIRPTASCLE